MTSSETECLIHLINGSFMVFEPQHAHRLRRLRVVTQSIGGGSNLLFRGPNLISPEAVYVVVRKKLGKFMKLDDAQNNNLDTNKALHEARVEECFQRETEYITKQRIEELRKRGIEETQATKQYDKAKLRIPIALRPNVDCSPCNEVCISHDDVIKALSRGSLNYSKTLLFSDLFERGFFVSSGMKFGADFLAYMGDPVRYHAQYAVRLVSSTEDGRVDLSKLDHNILNGFQRLTHTASKIPLFATVTPDATADSLSLESSCNDVTIMYWTIRERQYLNLNSKCDELERVNPTAKNTINKIRKNF